MVLVNFGPIFPIFGTKKIFPENPALSHTTSHGILAPCRNLEKMTQFQENPSTDRRTNGRKEERKDRQTDRPYFIEPFQILPGVQKAQEKFNK